MSDAIIAVIIMGGFNLISIFFTFWLNHIQIRKIEKNTNSITERLGDAKFAAGEASGKEKE